MAHNAKAKTQTTLDRAASAINASFRPEAGPPPPGQRESPKQVRREREYVQTELPALIQDAFTPKPKGPNGSYQVAQMPDGRLVREDAFVLASSAFQTDPRFAGQSVSSRIKTVHYWDTAPVKNKQTGQEYNMVQDWAKCKICGKRPTDPDLLVNMCTDPGSVPAGKKVLVQILYVAKEEGEPQATEVTQQE